MSEEEEKSAESGHPSVDSTGEPELTNSSVEPTGEPDTSAQGKAREAAAEGQAGGAEAEGPAAAAVAEEKPAAKPKRKRAAKPKGETTAEPEAAPAAAETAAEPEAASPTAAPDAEVEAAAAEAAPAAELETPVAPAPRRRRGARKPGEPAPVVRAQAKYVRSSARKARLVCDNIRGRSVEDARAILAHTPRSVARDWSRLLESAVANAEHNHELVGEDLVIKAIHADEGPTIKRFRPRAMGRATKIRKRTAHLTILLTPKN